MNDRCQSGDLPSSDELLWAAPVEFQFIHSPHGTFHVLHTHETLVETEVVSHGILGDESTN